VRRIWLLGLALLAAGCGGASEALQTGPTTTSEAPEWTTFELPEARLTVSHPPDWLRAPERLMPGLVDPRELVALSTFDARRGGENCAHMPENAIEDMGPADALVVVEERRAESEGGTPSDYPPRPGHFGSGDGYPSEAVDVSTGGRSSWTASFPLATWDATSMPTSRSGPRRRPRSGRRRGRFSTASKSLRVAGRSEAASLTAHARPGGGRRLYGSCRPEGEVRHVDRRGFILASAGALAATGLEGTYVTADGSLRRARLRAQRRLPRLIPLDAAGHRPGLVDSPSSRSPLE
jgi:hypothetical protein